MSLAVSLLSLVILFLLHLDKTDSFLPVGHHPVEEKASSRGSVTCVSNEFSCVSSAKCIPGRWACDGDEDCSDGSDEVAETCGARTCSQEEFSCGNEAGKCVPLTWVCDLHEDCKDGSDEKNCKGEKKCPFGRFACGNGMCTQESWKCDGQDDCGDGSDEQGCGRVTCAEDQITCGSGTCVSKTWACDGDADCPDGEDEKNCSGSSTLNLTNSCEENEFVCRDRHFCVHQAWTCDGDKDCPDGTDEDEDLCGEKKSCAKDEFTCSSGQCIQGHLQCSGRADCEDHSDEKDCAATEPKCNPETQFDCGDGKMCISIAQVCDYKNDCGAWQDEPRDSCGVNECLTGNGDCDQDCVDTKDGFHCQCRQGYEMDRNNTCQDIDECSTPGTCSQVCINRLGGFKCDCEHGYEKEPSDHTRCKAMRGQGQPSLLFSQKKDIRTLSLDRKIMGSVVSNTRSACAVDFSFKTGKVFWSDIFEEKIYSADLDSGSEHETVIAEGVVTPDGLAVDWVYSHLYWTDTGTNTISVTDFSGLSSVVLVTDNIEEPRAIALHPGKGWIFWSDWGRVPKIERAGMDGSHREVVLRDTVHWPNGLTIDLVLEKLYWVDAKLNTIGSANLDGSQARIILYSTSFLKHPFSISVFEDLMFWTEWDSHSIYQADKFTGGNITAVTGGPLGQIPMVVQVMHPYRQPAYPNHCQPYNGHCTHFCLPAPQVSPHSPRTSCACPRHMALMADGRSCKSKELHPVHTTEKARKETTTLESIGKIVDHIDAEALPLSTSNTGRIVGMVMGGILAAVVVTALVIFVLHRKLHTKKLITVKFNNPAFHQTQPSAEEPVFLQRQTAPASHVDLQPIIKDMVS